MPNIIPLLFYSNHTTNDIFMILYYNVGIFWQIAAVTYTIGPYWILDDLIIIYYLSSSQSILCVLPKLLSAAIIKMAWQNDCKKSSSSTDIFASHLSDLKNRTRKFNGVSSSVLLRLLLPFAAAASCVLTPPRSIIESPTASKIPPPPFPEKWVAPLFDPAFHAARRQSCVVVQVPHNFRTALHSTNYTIYIWQHHRQKDVCCVAFIMKF